MAHILSYVSPSMAKPTQETTMPQSLLSHLQSLFDLLFQTQPFQPLPRTYHQSPDWEAQLHTLQTPAAWRRQCRVR